jgi:hypothetical protein
VRTVRIAAGRAVYYTPDVTAALKGVWEAVGGCDGPLLSQRGSREHAPDGSLGERPGGALAGGSASTGRPACLERTPRSPPPRRFGRYYQMATGLIII